MYIYLAVRRPTGIGTCPKGFREFENFCERRWMNDKQRAWGTITYDRELTEKELEEYELEKWCP